MARLISTAFISTALLSVFAVVFDASAEQAVPLPKDVKILGTTLSLKESKGDEKRGFIAEYIPEGETFDDWTLMFAVRYQAGPEMDPKAAAAAAAKNVDNRKGNGDLVANSMVLAGPDGKSFAIDFMISEKNIYEHNVWRYYNTGKGLVSLQIARRAYLKGATDSSGTDLIRSVPEMRKKMLSELTRPDLPTPSFAK
jgi:hypothetical protein